MPLNVCYVDDEPDLCEAFSDYFASDEVVVSTYTDHEAAILAINQSHPDLVILDFRLRGTTGDEVARQLAADIPKVLITGDLAVASKFPFTKTLFKPYKIQDVFTLLEEFSKAKKAKFA